MTKPIHELPGSLDDCLLIDRYRIGRQLRQLKRHPDDRRLNKVMRDYLHSVSVVEKRKAQLPRITFPDQLPVSQKIDEIRAAIESHQVIVVAGETGSGKTTQLPKLCLDMGRGLHGRIGHTQPRRLAARSVAARLNEELLCADMALVGYQVRFSDTSRDETRIKLMTDGILLAETAHDRWLNQYDTIIIDEAHERSLNIDFLLGYLKRLLEKRRDLKVIITSATIDVESFSRHFDSAPVIEVTGRTYPVEIEYRPAEDSEEESLPERVLETVREIDQLGISVKSSFRDILVFLNGERQIREVADVLRKAQLKHTDILPLYSRLSAREQDRIFRSHSGRRIVLSTNVAETSLTVPGIGYVIDGGTARVSRYSVRSKVQRLPIEPVSQASARQRAGRCGRQAPGRCYRLYSEDDFASRPEFTDTEITRTHLGSVILQMLALGLGDVRDFPFLERPEEKSVRDGFRLLSDLGAITPDGSLTGTGRTMARMPVDPRFARIIIEASQLNCLHEVLIITSALSIQDPRERPADKTPQADQKHAQWQVAESDFMAFVNLWNGFEEQRQQLSQNKLRKYCQENYLSWMRMREWRELHRQLLLVCRDAGYTVNREPAEFDSVHLSLLSGFLEQVAFRQQDGDYLGARNRRYHIFPGSALRKKKAKWLLSAELVETSQLYARMNAQIEPAWIERQAAHLVKKDYLEPYWSKRQGRVLARERVSIYGMVLVENRRVPYSAIDPETSRQLFIEEGLVRGEVSSRFPFLRHNMNLVREIESLEERTRRRDILVDDSEMVHFYNSLIPGDVVDVKSLQRWYSKAAKTNRELLYFSRDQLERHSARDDIAQQYPDRLRAGSLMLPLDYNFRPGKEDDGVGVTVPVSGLGQLTEDALDWLVPGLLRDKCIALVKSLPKPVRKHFVPVPDTVDSLLPGLDSERGGLVVQLARLLEQKAGQQVSPADFSNILDPHLQMTITVVDSKGKKLASGKDLVTLKAKLGDTAVEELQQLDNSGFQREGVRKWDFGSLPEKIVLKQAGHQLDAYPAVEDHVDSVNLVFSDTLYDATQTSRQGVTRLFLLESGMQRYLEKNLLRDPRQRLQVAMLAPYDRLLDCIIMSACDSAFNCDDIPRSTEEFKERLLGNKSVLVEAAQKIEKVMLEIAGEYQQVVGKLKQISSPKQLQRKLQVKQHLDELIGDDFPSSVPVENLGDFPRYLRAIFYRLDRFNADEKKEAEAERLLQLWQQRFDDQYRACTDRKIMNDKLANFRWLLEEFRVSLFAQQLGTKVPVSSKRLEGYWKEL